MKSLIISPMGECRVEDLNDYDGVRHALAGGYLEMLALSNRAVMWIDEDGKGKSLPVNVTATHIMNHALMNGDFIVGTAVITGPSRDENVLATDLPDDLIKEYQHGTVQEGA